MRAAERRGRPVDKAYFEYVRFLASVPSKANIRDQLERFTLNNLFNVGTKKRQILNRAPKKECGHRVECILFLSLTVLS